MTNEITKKAVEMLLKGATLISEPCPYCKGVRVMKEGHALCVSCGREPRIEENKSTPKSNQSNNTPSLVILEQKLEKLSIELSHEKDHKKQHEILKSINSLTEIISKLKK